MLIDMSGFITVENGDFMHKGRPWKGIGFNHHLLAWSSKASIFNIMNYISRVGGNEIRFWLFDQLNPSDANGNFHFLDYPLDDPEILSTVATIDFEADAAGWTLGADFTRSNEASRTGSWSLKQVSTTGFIGIVSEIVTVSASTWYTLTFYYKKISQVSFGPLLEIRKGSDNSVILDGGLLEISGPESEGGWQRKQVQFNSGTETGIKINIKNFNGAVTYYYDDFWLNEQGTPIISPRESQFLILDFVADEARKRGIRLCPSFADNTTNYNTKKTYVTWANAVYGAGLSTAFPYIGFFNSSFAKQLYKDNMASVLNRKNTINGMIYREDPTFKSWELGNELRADRSDPSGINGPASANIALVSGPGGWTDEMSTYIVETLGAKQLVTFGSMSHAWEYKDGDSVFNGSFYGVDYRIMATLPYIHFLDFHLYPTQDALQPFLYPLGELDIVSFGQVVANRPPPIKSSSTSVTSKVTTLNAATIAGDVLVVHLSFNGTPGSTPVVTDSGGNTYTLTSNSSTVYHFTSTHTVPASTVSASWTTVRTVNVYIDENSGRENANNGRSKAGLEAQLLDYINVGKAVGKPAVISEHGYSIDLNNRYNFHYNLQPRYGAFNNLFEFWFRNGGAQIDLWSATIVGGTSYSVNLGDRDGEAITDNSNDTNVNALIRYWNRKLRHHDTRAEMDRDLKYAESELTPRTFDGHHQGITTLGTSGEALSYGNLVYLDEFTSTWKKAGALLTIARDRKIGMCALAAGSGESIKVLQFGTIRADSLFPTLIPGRAVYMSETVGLISNDKPTTTGAVHRVIGFADTADQITFQPAGNFTYVS